MINRQDINELIRQNEAARLAAIDPEKVAANVEKFRAARLRRMEAKKRADEKKRAESGLLFDLPPATSKNNKR